MTDRHVDELLADLDRALAVEPSPSVAAAVRTRIAQPPATGWFWLNWRPVFIAGAAAAALAVIAAGYFVWPRGRETPAPVQTLTTHPADPAPSAVAPGAHERRTTSARRATPARTTAAVEHEPEVLVSPDVRLALVQLAAAVRDGRINPDSIPPDGPIVLPDPIVIPKFAIEPLKLDMVPGPGGGKEIR